MGYGIKNNLDLDITYEMIIKPCIQQNKLVPFPLYPEGEYNAYRCDEIVGVTSIDYKYVTCLNGADIVIADISTMNVNAIYELGARHALRTRSTILLCAKEKEREFKFFDITYVPIIFYEHAGSKLMENVISETKTTLNKYLDFAINSASPYPDNPIQRALNEQRSYQLPVQVHTSIYELYTQGKNELDNNNYGSALYHLTELYESDQSEENLLLLALAQYKEAEQRKSFKGLIDCRNFIIDNTDIENSTSEHLFGRLAAICLRIYNLYGDCEFYYEALQYYRRGATYSRRNLYCPRNYCALLFRVYEVTDDTNIIREYFYTALHFAKLFLNQQLHDEQTRDFEDAIYYAYNANDLKSIVEGSYIDYEKMRTRLDQDPDISARQRETILIGMDKLKKDISHMYDIVKPF